MSKTIRNSSIDAIKGVAIVLVMIGHVFVHNHMEDPYIYDFIKAVQMPLFMIISGYLCGQGRKISDLKTYGKVLGKRAIAYLMPFFSWLTLMHWNNLAEAYKRIFFELDFGLWFLAVLFILTFMVSTAQLAAGKFREKNIVLSETIFWAVYGAMCLVLVVQILSGNTFLSPYLTIIYVPFYMLGYVSGNYGKNYFCWESKTAGKIDCKNNWGMKGSAALCFFLFLYLIAARDLNSMESKMDTIIQMAASFLGSVSIIYGVFLWKDGKIKNLFAKIGLYTLEIYVVHYHFANILNFHDKQYDAYTPEGAVFVIVSFVAMCAVTFAGIWLLKKMKLLDFFLFGKRERFIH